MCNRSDKVIIEPESGEIVCSSCGMVISDKIPDINWAERYAFNPEEMSKNRTRAGGFSTHLDGHVRGLDTMIGRTDKDAAGHKLDAITSSNMARLRMWDTRTRYLTSNDRNLVLAFNELDILKDKLGLSDAVVEKTAYVYRKAQARGLIKGRSITALLTASVYASCREMGIPWTIKDITEASNIKRKHLAKAYRLLISEFGYKVPLCDPIKCIAKVANKANLTENTKRQAIRIMNEVIEKQIPAGKDPMGLAATILYISCLKTGEVRTQTQIAHASGVTEVTVRNRLKDLK
ncbi:MAG: transcription initiation factor IIB, partial [Nitrososphaeraceae archaeon]|nr:transcription initiation factor IIB [Nitrososphaeraceae archaeon]